VGVALYLPASLAMGVRHGKFDAHLRAPNSLGAPSVQSVEDYENENEINLQ
jgi:hypothetical protein